LLAFLLLVGGSPRAVDAAFTESAVSFGVASGDSMSYVAGFVDYDGDFDPDFFVTNHWKSDAEFYRNEGGTVFVEKSGHFTAPDRDRHDMLWGDLDNDGDPDQYILHGAGPDGHDNELYWNEGQGVLIDGAAGAGVEDPEGRGREVTFADFNGDHLLDMFVVNDLRDGFTRPSALFWNQGNQTFLRHPNDSLIFRSRQHVSSADFDLDGDVDLITTDPPWVEGEFWRNDGSWWVDATASIFPGITLPLGQAQGLSWCDYDNDGDLDLFTCGGNRGVWDHAAVDGDSLRWYLESDPGLYKGLTLTTDGDSVTIDAHKSDYKSVAVWYGGGGDSTATYPATFALADIGGEPPDLTGGSQGVFLWSVADTVRLESGGPGSAPLNVGGSLRENGSGFVVVATSQDPPPPYSLQNWSNRLFRNEGNGTFSEVTALAFAVNDSTFNSKGAAWGDYDNDGWPDLYVSNGGTVATGNQTNYLYRNNGNGTFTDVAATEGVVGASRGMTDGAAWADVDGDGFLDLYVDNGAEHPPFGVGPRELFMNTPNGNHWLSLRLRGLTSNGSGIGARVRVVTASGVQWRTRLGESDNCYSNDHAIHVGLGSDTMADTVQVHWPSGHIDTYENVLADARYVAVEFKPLRPAQNPHLTVLTGDIFDTILDGETQDYSVAIDNFGGLAADWVARYEDCAGQPVGWASMDPESSTVFPGGTTPLTLTIDTDGLATGSYCTKVIFESNSFQGPDTLRVTVNVTLPVGADPGTVAPDRFGLSLPRPNPSRGALEVVLAMPAAGPASVELFDVAGRRVTSLLSGTQPAGYHAVRWDARDGRGRRVGAGVYFVRAHSRGEISLRKLVLLE
jgi:hypothetical protein